LRRAWMQARRDSKKLTQIKRLVRMILESSSSITSGLTLKTKLLMKSSKTRPYSDRHLMALYPCSMSMSSIEPERSQMRDPVISYLQPSSTPAQLTRLSRSAT
jgi:hypothetical protein